MHNRSVPTDSPLPHIFYEDVAEAVDWLSMVLGFQEHFRYGEPVAGAQVRFGNSYLMLSRVRPGRSTPNHTGSATQMISLFVGEIEPSYLRAKAARAEIVEELNETCYGERQFGVKDIGGHVWIIAQHLRDVHPTEWGAMVPL